MFNLFKRKIKIRTLQKKFDSIMLEWQNIPRNNKKENERKKAEAVKILREMETLKL